jgi:hypothetical protein
MTNPEIKVMSLVLGSKHPSAANFSSMTVTSSFLSLKARFLDK